MNTLEELLKQLHDIEGVDPVSLWPLAVGWWILIIAGVILFTLAVFLLVYWISFKRSWKCDTLKKLSQLEKSLSEQTARQTAIDLSEYLRRIALKRFSRKECAGLVGIEWLQWLKKNDAKEFDWETKGKLLTNVPYSPLDSRVSIQEIKSLIQAAKDWVR